MLDLTNLAGIVCAFPANQFCNYANLHPFISFIFNFLVYVQVIDQNAESKYKAFSIKSCSQQKLSIAIVPVYQFLTPVALA